MLEEPFKDGWRPTDGDAVQADRADEKNRG